MLNVNLQWGPRWQALPRYYEIEDLIGSLHLRLKLQVQSITCVFKCLNLQKTCKLLWISDMVSFGKLRKVKTFLLVLLIQRMNHSDLVEKHYIIPTKLWDNKDYHCSVPIARACERFARTSPTTVPAFSSWRKSLYHPFHTFERSSCIEIGSGRQSRKIKGKRGSSPSYS